jgi:hypothetical protein
MLDARPSLLKESLRALECSSSLGAAHAAAATIQHLLKSIGHVLLDQFARENDAMARLFGVLDKLDDLDNANALLDEQVESACGRHPPPPQLINGVCEWCRFARQFSPLLRPGLDATMLNC